MTIPQPQRGQPIDVNYINAIVTEVNSISTKLSNNYTVLSNINNGVDGLKDQTINNIRFFAESKNVRQGTVILGEEMLWYVDFTPSFKYRPVVTATPVNKSTSTVGNNITVVIKEVSTSRVSGNMIFNKAGTVDVAINVLAIGMTAILTQ